VRGEIWSGYAELCSYNRPRDPLMLSVLVICCNEEGKIERCLASVQWADEVLVIDSGSTDRTVDLARPLAHRVLYHPWEGYSRQREWGLGQVCGDWVLMLDADEEVTPELAAEIRNTMQTPPDADGFFISRRNFFLGRPLRSSIWAPDYQMKLFRRERARIDPIEVHEGVLVNGKTGRLTGQILHYTVSSLVEYLDRFNEYTSLEVSGRIATNGQRKTGRCYLLMSTLAQFTKLFLSRRGFRDGIRGFILCVLSGMYKAATYAKLWEYQRALSSGDPLPPILSEELKRVRSR
jgi:glycosyltransferase involved in cell wall biosynthesis